MHHLRQVGGGGAYYAFTFAATVLSKGTYLGNLGAYVLCLREPLQCMAVQTPPMLVLLVRRDDDTLQQVPVCNRHSHLQRHHYLPGTLLTGQVALPVHSEAQEAVGPGAVGIHAGLGGMPGSGCLLQLVPGLLRRRDLQPRQGYEFAVSCVHS